MKTCAKCNVSRPLDRFPIRKSNGRHRGVCKDCNNTKARHLQATDPQYREKKNAVARRYRKTPAGQRNEVRRNRSSKLRFTYGIEPADYDRMAAEQGGVCAICRNPPVGKKYLAVDHDHETGRIRALLCDRCNVGLGSFKDNPEYLEQAAAYLRLWRDHDHPVRVRRRHHEG